MAAPGTPSIFDSPCSPTPVECLIDVHSSPFTPTFVQSPTTPIAVLSPPCTPTEPDCFSTDVDPDTDLDPADGSLDLLGFLEHRWGDVIESDAKSDTSALDSELTDNENPIDVATNPPNHTINPCPPAPPCHWTDDDEFWDKVNEVMDRVLQQPWYDNSFFFHAPVLFDDVFYAASLFISTHLVGVCQFKIGITNDPYLRWFRNDCGYFKSAFSHMSVLYAAPTSKVSLYDVTPAVEALRRESTGAMETRLIDAFAHLCDCLNRQGAGGDCPSAGCPHFVYVVW